eukprot:jgi/Mesvir1/29602/Mv21458-RA.1
MAQSSDDMTRDAMDTQGDVAVRDVQDAAMAAAPPEDAEEPEEGEARMDDHSTRPAPVLDPMQRPPAGAEVFVGSLPHSVCEEDLRKVFERLGEIVEIRMVKDATTGLGKGFAFVGFRTKEDAAKAVEACKDVEIKDTKVRVNVAQTKNRLFIGNVPKSFSHEELLAILSKDTVGIEHLNLVKDPACETKNRGFAFVEFYNHSCAEAARKVYTKSTFKLDGNIPTVNFAEPRAEPDPQAQAQVKIVYVKNLPESWDEERLAEVFRPFGKVVKSVLPSKPGTPRKDFGFVHYEERAEAEAAVEAMKGKELDGKVLEVEFAKPPSDRRAGEGSHRGRTNTRGGYVYGGIAMVPTIVYPNGQVGYMMQAPARIPRGSGRYQPY